MYIAHILDQVGHTQNTVQVAKKGVTAAGYLSRGEQAPEILDLLVIAMLETASVKSDVLPFAAGEALCFAFGGVFYVMSSILLSLRILSMVEDNCSLQLPMKVETIGLEFSKPHCAGVKIGSEQLLHTPVDSLAQADAQSAGKQDAEDMQVWP